MDQCLGQTQMPATTYRGIPTRQRHLAGHPTTLLGRRHPGRSLIGATRRIQRRGRARLTRSSGRLHPLQPRDPLDQRRLIGIRIHRRQHIQIEHTFDYTRLHRRIWSDASATNCSAWQAVLLRVPFRGSPITASPDRSKLASGIHSLPLIRSRHACPPVVEQPVRGLPTPWSAHSFARFNSCADPGVGRARVPVVLRPGWASVARSDQGQTVNSTGRLIGPVMPVIGLPRNVTIAQETRLPG